MVEPRRKEADMKTEKDFFEFGEKLSNGFLLEDVSDVDTEIYMYILDNMAASVQKGNRFFLTSNCDYISHKILTQRKLVVMNEWLDRTGNRDAVESTLFYGGMDYGHTRPGWEDVLRLGIFGLRNRAESYIGRKGNTEKQNRFYNIRIRDKLCVLR